MSIRKKRINRHTLHEMRKIYYRPDVPYIDWMGYPLTEDNIRSYHHIVKREDLEKEGKDSRATVENGAYLGKRSHEMLHKIEQVDKDLYDSWNYLFLVINRMKCYPIPAVWDMVFALQKQSEELFKEEPKVLRKKRQETAKQ